MAVDEEVFEAIDSFIVGGFIVEGQAEHGGPLDEGVEDRRKRDAGGAHQAAEEFPRQRLGEAAAVADAGAGEGQPVVEDVFPGRGGLVGDGAHDPRGEFGVVEFDPCVGDCEEQDLLEARVVAQAQELGGIVRGRAEVAHELDGGQVFLEREVEEFVGAGRGFLQDAGGGADGVEPRLRELLGAALPLRAQALG